MPQTSAPDSKIARSIDAQLHALSNHPFGKDLKRDEAVLVVALDESHYRVVARAADLAAERLCYAAISALKRAYSRLLDNAAKKDPQCHAKQAIVRALVALDCPDAQFYLAGLGYRQMEPVWGGSADTAVDVRASCAMGLVNSGYPHALHEITALLNDTETRARLGAVRAIACGIPSEAELLLRFKILIGDAEPEVIGECLSGLLKVAAATAVSLVTQQLAHADEAIREYAAIALGESQLPEALDSLKQAWEAVFVSPEQKRILSRAAALHRTDAAFDWLIKLIAEGSLGAAEAAIEALSIYKENLQLTARIKTTLSSRAQTRLQEFFERCWS